MDEDLKAYLDGKFSYLDGKFAELDGRFTYLDRKFAYLDGKFAELDGKLAELDGKLAELDGKFAEVDRKFAQAAEALHDTETRLLSEFWKWGRVTDHRIRRVEASDAITAERLTAMEERIFTLERKVAGSKE